MFTHDVLVPAGSDAIAIARLWDAFLVVSVAVYLAVLAALFFAIRRARRGHPAGAMQDPGSRRVVGAAVVGTVVVLAGMLTTELVLGRAVLDESRPEGEPVRIRLTGHQYWWDVEYQPDVPGERLRTANELFVPVGRPVELSLRSNDVIHSFWLPSLAGKRDLIPGLERRIRFRVEVPGHYEGQCAEFCGYQHANMRLVLTALEPAAFDAWQARQRQPADPPGTAELEQGRQVFERSSCALCHAVRGSAAQATEGPDLTHFGSRRRIAASAARNEPAALATWISNPQRLKPGTRMPATALQPAELRALVAWLGSLQ